MYMLNNTGERPHPCLTPLFMCIGSDIPCYVYVFLFYVYIFLLSYLCVVLFHCVVLCTVCV